MRTIDVIFFFVWALFVLDGCGSSKDVSEVEVKQAASVVATDDVLLSISDEVFRINVATTIPEKSTIQVTDYLLPTLSGDMIVEPIGYVNVKVKNTLLKNKTKIYVNVRFKDTLSQLTGTDGTILPVLLNGTEEILVGVAGEGMTIKVFCDSTTHVPRDCRSRESINTTITEVSLSIDGTNATADTYVGSLTFELVTNP